jgi:hypothetical protein
MLRAEDAQAANAKQSGQAPAQAPAASAADPLTADQRRQMNTLKADLERLKADNARLQAASPAESQRRIQRALEATPLGRAVLAEEAKQAVRGQP